MNSKSFSLPLFSSCIIHLLLVLAVSLTMQQNSKRQTLLPIGMVDLPATEPRKLESPPAFKQPLPPQPQVEKPKEMRAKNELAAIEKPTPRPVPASKEELVKTAEPVPTATAPVAPGPSVLSGGAVEGGGSAAGAGNSFGKGDVGVLPGPGTSGGGEGSAAAGLGGGSGAPGLPAQTAPLKTNREAKPIQSARANYPAIALRAGLEADVTLKIEVDPNGSVTRAEIIKSGGAGFDEEALKAVKLSRFEPAQKNGQNVPAEFAFIYKFRLRR